MRIGIITQCCTTIIAALVISFAFVWELSLVMMFFMPVMILVGKVQQKLANGYSKRDKNSVEEGGKVNTMAIYKMNIVEH